MKSKWITVIVLLAAFACPGNAAIQTKTITRTEDPVIMECKDFQPLLGSTPDSFSLVALSGGQWSPVPFQIDQKKPDGSYAFTNGPEKSADPDPNLDANDELVFMAMDVGDRCGECRMPEGAGAGVEIEVTDPKDGAKGWAYLFRFAGKAPRSDKDYVRLEFDRQKGRTRVITDRSVVEKQSDRSTPDFLARRNPDGSLGPNLVDKFKIRESVDVPLLNQTYDLKLEERIIAHELAWIDGAVRVLILNRFELAVTTYITVEAPSTSVTSYCRNQSISPITYSQPKVSGVTAAIMAIADKLTANDRMDVYMDFRPVIYGSHFFCASHPESDDVVVDGKMSEAEKSLSQVKPGDWIAAESPQGTVVLRMILPPQLKNVKTTLYYEDDKDLADPPENAPGVHAIGYSMYSFGDAFKNEDDVNKVKGMVIQVYTYYKADPGEKGVMDLLDILDHPLAVTAGTISM
jgi:hypothetical protein